MPGLRPRWSVYVVDPVSKWTARALGVCLVLLLCAWFDIPIIPPAYGAADVRPCLTSSEWARVDVGMSRSDVRAVLDGDGNPGPSTGVRWYRVCGKAPGHVRAVVWYRDRGRTMDGGVWIVGPLDERG